MKKKVCDYIFIALFLTILIVGYFVTRLFYQ